MSRRQRSDARPRSPATRQAQVQADSCFNLGASLYSQGDLERALAAYQAGLAIEPDRAQAYVDVGFVLRRMGSLEGALTAFEHAAKLSPSLAVAHYNRALTHKLLGHFEKARAAFARAIECAPNSLVNRLELRNLRRQICDWDGLDREEQRDLELFRTVDTAVAPFAFVSMPASRADQLEAGCRFAQSLRVPDALKFQSYRTSAERGGRIRVGFLSSDFFEHATAMLLVQVLERLDRGRFELFGYCYSRDDGSALRRRIRQAFDRLADIRALPHHEAARTINGDGIDILVDLKGYTRGSRPKILVHRPAPTQVNYLGYPATMGADVIDYIIADAVVAPMQHQAQYAERIVHLPHCYQPNDSQRGISEERLDRTDLGLPAEAFVFCSFNNSFKLNATTFDIWMRLLAHVPGSVLWLLVAHDLARDNLRREAAARGIEPARLVFAERLPVARHLARHRLADLFLDSLPCNAHTTASDALWAGLPVLTCVGQTFAGRVAASLLMSMNLPELVTGSLDDYERVALDLARDGNKLASIRRKLAAQRDVCPLFDSARYARNLGQAFETMVGLRRSGESPRSFAVTEGLP
jgi:predicted O-linked N-acetylglucosamine transferase (SPINDLY family)